MTGNDIELYEMNLSLKAEIAALKEMMCESSRDLAEKHNALAAQYRAKFLADWREKQKDALVE